LNEIDSLVANINERIGIRHIIRLLREVWMKVGLENINTYERVAVKALLDNGAIELFINRIFVEK